MQQNNIQINERIFNLNTDLEKELKLQSDKNCIFNLSYLCGLTLSGDKAAEFLQGQFTSDILKVNNNQGMPGALCNLKGRVIATSEIIFWSKFIIISPCDMAEKIQKNLQKTAMFSRVIINRDDNLAFYGFFLQNNKDKIPFAAALPANIHEVTYDNNYLCYKIAEKLYIFVTTKDRLNQLTSNFDSSAIKGDYAWHNLILSAGLIEIYPESSGLFLPHRLDFHKTNYLNFNKGCYIGQEIIARMHYRSKPKHEMYVFEIQTHRKVFSGQKVYSSHKNEIGEVIDYSRIADNKYILAISILSEYINLEGIDENTWDGHG